MNWKKKENAMTRRLLVLACAGLAWVATARADEAAKGHPDSAGWENLFAEDLSNAVFPKGVWYFENGVLTATEDQNIWTKKEYGDCVIDLEFKNAPGTNSGVIVYASDMKEWIPNSVEIQIADDFSPKWATSPKSWQCAAIFGHQGAKKSAVKKPGQWNRMTVTCKGTKLSVALNGEAVTEIDMKDWTSAKKNPDGTDIPPWLSKPLAELRNKGRIGLQGKHGGVPIYFRNMKVKSIE
jgi:hypothetical protein